MEQYRKVLKADTDENKNEDIPPKYGYGYRHIQFIIFCMCLVVTFITRSHIGVTIVAMTSRCHASSSTGNETVHLDAHIENDSIGHGDQGTLYKTYDWAKPIQETVLFSFVLGYCLATFPAALVCQRWGGKLPLQISMLVNAIISLLTPWLTQWGGWKALSVCRVTQGLTQAGTYPGIQTLLAKWTPTSERATMSSYVYTGSVVGNIIGFQISGILAESWGWAVNFWTVGAVCLVCFILLSVFGSASPHDHSTISAEEKRYIIGNDSAVVPTRRPAPWKAILTSGRVWANFATHVGSGVAFIFVMAQMPTYTHYILGVNVKSSGLLSSLPYFVSFFTSCAFGVLSDYLTNRKLISIKTARRLSNSISQVGMAVCLIGASFSTSMAAAVTCFVVAMSCNAAVHTGWMLNHIDLTPEYSGTLMACGNTLTNSCALILPVLVSNIVVDMGNAFQWHIMLWLVAGFCFFTNIIFVAFLSVDVQPWNNAVDAAGNEDGTTMKEKDNKNQL